MDLSFLPPNYTNALKNCDTQNLYEIRVRVGYPVKIKIKNNFYYLTSSGCTLFGEKAIKSDYDDIIHVIKNVTEHSLYAYNDKIKNGYLTTSDGIRIGLAGECVMENGCVQTLKNFSSLNIRIPHEIVGCADKLYEYVYKKNFFNTLIISPPFFGKTTLLKDLAKTINIRHDIPIMIIDERGEFVNISGQNIDTIRFSDKFYAFECGIRALSPYIVITDELCTKSDWLCAQKASTSAVKIIASCHGGSITDVVKNQNYIRGIFERYVVLKDVGQAGIIDKVYDGDCIEL